MGRRRVSEPGAIRGVYFLLFDVPATRFRQELLERLGAARGNASLFDPAARRSRGLRPLAEAGLPDYGADTTSEGSESSGGGGGVEHNRSTFAK